MIVVAHCCLLAGAGRAHLKNVVKVLYESASLPSAVRVLWNYGAGSVSCMRSRSTPPPPTVAYTHTYIVICVFTPTHMTPVNAVAYRMLSVHMQLYYLRLICCRVNLRLRRLRHSPGLLPLRQYMTWTVRIISATRRQPVIVSSLTTETVESTPCLYCICACTISGTWVPLHLYAMVLMSH